jgi:hypothetical protein
LGRAMKMDALLQLRWHNTAETVAEPTATSSQAVGLAAAEGLTDMSTEDPRMMAAISFDAAAADGAPTAGAMPPPSPELRTAVPKPSAAPPDCRCATARDPDGTRQAPRTSTAAFGASLLTPGDILSRLCMTSADPAKWMRRTFNKHGVPYVHACGKMRATEAQYQLLLEKITCSRPAAAGRTASTISEVRSSLAASASTSKRTIQGRVTKLLRRT